MADDRWRVLETHKAFPSADGITFAQFEARSTRALLEHKRVWDRENTAEIVELLREAYLCWGEYGFVGGKDWGQRMDALLDRVGGKKP